MGRFKQPRGKRGSLKWIQNAINQAAPRKFDELILSRLNCPSRIAWASPLSSDDHAEYTDLDFLDKIGATNLGSELKTFWPNGGPHWDALGRSDTGDILLVEAKAHIAEICSSPSGAHPASRKIIEAALTETASHLGAKPRAKWTEVFYQLNNRLAHLYFLRKRRVKAWLILANFVGDDEMGGPSSSQEWEAAYKVVWHVLGIEVRNPLSKYIVHVYPSASDFAT